jgi:hypothetical protein
VDRNIFNIYSCEIPQTSPACPYDECGIKVKINVEYWWNDTDKGKLKYWEINLFQCHCVNHTSHMDWVTIEPGPPLILILKLMHIHFVPHREHGVFPF